MKIKFKSFYMLCFAASTLTFTSCEDFLDRQEDEKLTFEKSGKPKYDQTVLVKCHVILPNFNGGYIGDNEPYLGASDECTIAYDRQYRYINFGSWNASTVPYYSMDKYYKGIRECNILMQNVHKCSDPLATQKISIDTIGKPVLLAPTIIF